MWYPEIEMVFQRGSSALQYAKMSVMSRSGQPVGRCTCPKAMYSLEHVVLNGAGQGCARDPLLGSHQLVSISNVEAGR